MGQKGHPKSQRLKITRDWESKWFASKQEFGLWLAEDQKIRKHIMNRSSSVGTARVYIERAGGKTLVTIHTARPGLAIGRKGAEIEALKKELHKLIGSPVWIEVEEIKRPDVDATLVAQNIANQLRRRIPYKRAMKKALQSTMDAGGAGVRIQIAGRLNGAEIARREWYIKGRVPLHTLRAQIDHAKIEAQTTYGTLGVKVWINRQIEEAAVKKGA
ncbi:MAG: 30S ribosomal protein S3 [Waddliaceae bacterium]|nr:30S ribosomal protein S3 [Waddliaceae bacterium]